MIDFFRKTAVLLSYNKSAGLLSHLLQTNTFLFLGRGKSYIKFFKLSSYSIHNDFFKLIPLNKYVICNTELD